MARVRVLLGGSHPWTQQQLEATDWASLEVVGKACGGSELVRQVLKLRPDAVVLDAHAAEGNARGAWSELERSGAEARTLLLCLHHTESDAGVVASACAYLVRSSQADEIARIVREVHDRGCPRAHAATAAGPRQRAVLDDLTQRERQVLAWIAQEKTSKEIAAILDISPRTVDTHRSSLMKKLGIRSVAGLVRYALHAGITDAR
jgi:two-component system NarL family response regulator